ncbi:MAG: flagellar motor switch protein FliN [Pseudomonadota bacterium]
MAKATGPHGGRDLEAVYDVPVRVTAVIGSASLPVNELFKLRAGKVVELSRKVGEPVDIFVNNRLVARGEVVLTVNDTLGITMTEIVRTEIGE